MSVKSVPTSISGIVAKDAYIENTPDMTASFVRVTIEIMEGARKGQYETVIVEHGKAVKADRALNPSDSRHKPRAYFVEGSKITATKLRRKDSDTLTAGFVSTCAPLRGFDL